MCFLRVRVMETTQTTRKRWLRALLAGTPLLAACGGSSAADAPEGSDDGGNTLTDGPPGPGEHGPFSASDSDRHGTVTRSA